MAEAYFESSEIMSLESPIQKYTSTCDLQSFYENFNPECEDIALVSPRSEETENNIWSNTQLCDTNTGTQHKLEQIFPELQPQQQPIQVHNSFYNNWCSQDITHTHQQKQDYTSCNGVKKTISKKKRKRTTFTTEQIVAMEQIFKTRPYICREDRLRLAERVQVNERAIKVWFQNRRRMSEKRERVELPDSPSSIDTSDSDRFTYIESLINERTDRFGNVTLDDHIVTELVNVIDDHLPWETEVILNATSHDNFCRDHTSLLNSVKSDTSQNSFVMYEPISPVSVLDEFLQ